MRCGAPKPNNKMACGRGAVRSWCGAPPFSLPPFPVWPVRRVRVEGCATLGRLSPFRSSAGVGAPLLTRSATRAPPLHFTLRQGLPIPRRPQPLPPHFPTPCQGLRCRPRSPAHRVARRRDCNLRLRLGSDAQPLLAALRPPPPQSRRHPRKPRRLASHPAASRPAWPLPPPRRRPPWHFPPRRGCAPRRYARVSPVVDSAGHRLVSSALHTHGALRHTGQPLRDPGPIWDRAQVAATDHKRVEPHRLGWEGEPPPVPPRAASKGGGRLAAAGD